MKVTLYRAEPRGTRQVDGLTSWTTSRAHAEEYTYRFVRCGGRQLYRAEVTVGRLLDLRRDPRRQLLRATGLDLDDYDDKSQDLYRALANVFRAHGFEWVAFGERPEPTYDESLFLGAGAVPVTAVTDPARTRDAGER